MISNRVLGLRRVFQKSYFFRHPVQPSLIMAKIIFAVDSPYLNAYVAVESAAYLLREDG